MITHTVSWRCHLGVKILANLPDDKTEYDKRSNGHVNQPKSIINASWIDILFL